MLFNYTVLNEILLIFSKFKNSTILLNIYYFDFMTIFTNLNIYLNIIYSFNK